MLTEKGIKVDFYCKNKKDFPKNPPVGFIVGYTNKDKITEYIYTGEGWSAIRAHKVTNRTVNMAPDANKVVIVSNPNGDTRTSPPEVSYTDFQIANRMHIADVERLMDLLADMISYAGTNHDYTKITNEADFYRDFCNTKTNGVDFTLLEWYKMHVSTERHHLNEHCPENVTLIDVLEMICDCCAAGAARSGQISNVTISNEILQKAVKNTVTLIANSIIVE